MERLFARRSSESALLCLRGSGGASCRKRDRHNLKVTSSLIATYIVYIFMEIFREISRHMAVLIEIVGNVQTK